MIRSGGCGYRRVCDPNHWVGGIPNGEAGPGVPDRWTDKALGRGCGPLSIRRLCSAPTLRYSERIGMLLSAKDPGRQWRPRSCRRVPSRCMDRRVFLSSRPDAPAPARRCPSRECRRQRYARSRNRPWPWLPSKTGSRRQLWGRLLGSRLLTL